MSPIIFISYSHENSESAARIAEELQARGLRTWQDIHDIRLGRRIESEMEDGIARSDAVLHLLTPAALNSPPIRREIDLSVGRRRRDASFIVLTAAQDLGDDHAAVGERTLAEFGENLANDWLQLLPPGPDALAYEDAAAYAKHVLRTFFPRGRGPDDDEPWRLGLHTRGSAGAGHDLELDWRPLFGSDDRGPGDFEAWSRAWRAVRDGRDVLADHSPRRRLTLTAAAHQSAGVLFGLAFCCHGHWQLQVKDPEGAEWHRAPGGAAIDPFIVTRQPEAIEGTYLTVEAEVARQVLSAVSARIAETGEEPRARVLAHREGGPGWVTPATGSALARALSTEIRAGVDELGTRRVELFLAAPLPLSVLLGAELGAAHAELALFEFHDGRYEPALAIPEEER